VPAVGAASSVENVMEWIMPEPVQINPSPVRIPDEIHGPLKMSDITSP
jgi:hypothetical protein